MEIKTNAQRSCRPGPSDWFTGTVFIDEVLNTTPPARAASAVVTFTPGARTAWHTHPLGQTLFVLSGLGWAQTEGEPARAIRPGDVVLIAPGENHWHGAEAGHTMSHLAMQEADETGSPVTWGQHVTDEHYNALQLLRLR